VIPFSGWIEKVYIGTFATFFLLALIKGFVHVRAKRMALHREWMIRAFAIALAVATMRLIFIPALLVVADPTQQQLQTLSAAAFLVAFVVHVSVAEAWIRLTQPGTSRGVPALRGGAVHAAAPQTARASRSCQPIGAAS
jgi:uncharacterized membrane protein YozB (DUF420 family)